MILRNRYFLLYLACAVLLGIPSFLVWLREPFLITKNEFDFFLGLFGADFGDMDLGLVMFGKGLHFLLILLMGWAYYRLLLELSEADRPLEWRDLAAPSALMIGITFFYLPWLSPDVFFYFGTGWMESNYGLNPYQKVIADAPGWESDPAFRNVFPAWRYIITPYAPLFVKFIGALTQVAGGDDRVALLLVKVVFVLCHLLNGWLVCLIARQLGFKDRLAVLLYLVSPVPLLDYIGWAHNDVLMMSCLLAALWAMLGGRHILATVLLGLGAGLKYFPVLLFPYLFLYMTRGRSPVARLPRALGLGLLLAAVVLAPSLWYENGVWNFLRLFRGQDQLHRNFLYLMALPAVTPSTDEVTLAATLAQLKLALKLFFLGLYALIAYRLWRRGPALTSDHLFASVVVMLLLYFVIGSPEIHEWYIGWFLCFVFWVNDRAYYDVGMLLTVALNALVIYEVRSPYPVMFATWQLCFLVLWAGLYYLLKQKLAKAPRRSPLLADTDPPNHARPAA
ncbi:MAG: DUF2029 domain-containing protein [Gemmataceae bacterium]|nr:DUF2029 domain-containing protein [Gemmataceae bacterium]